MLRPGPGAASRFGPAPRLRTMSSDALTEAEIALIRTILWEAFGDGDDAFAEDDWTHVLGGTHFVLDLDGEIVTHAAIVERQLWIRERPVRTGYIEAVATDPGHQGRGFGSVVMEAVTDHVRESFDLGALGTGRLSFYQRLGWEAWKGPAYVRDPGGLIRTRDDEGYILVLRTPMSPSFEGTEPLSCLSRVGEPW